MNQNDQPPLTPQGRALRRERQVYRVLMQLPLVLALLALIALAFWLGTHGYTVIFK